MSMLQIAQSTARWTGADRLGALCRAVRQCCEGSIITKS